MTIRIERNAAGNCVTFHGQTNPVYYNACLSAEVVDTDYVNIINEIASNENETRYEYYRLHFSEFQSADFNTFTDAQSVVDYINEVGNVRSQNDSVVFGPEDTLDFQLDDTSTSVIFDNGDHHGVNSIKAVALTNGLISIQAMRSDHEFYQLPHTGCSINGTAIPGGINDVVDALNEYFTVGAFEQVVIRDPYSTMVADVGGVAANGSLVGALALDPVGEDVGASSGSHNNNAGWLSSDTIDQAGEYFTFDIRVKGQIGFGLVHSDDSYNNGHYPSGTNTTYADPSTFCNGVNSAHYGWQFSHHFHPTPNGPWTNYGGNTSYVGGPGWTSTAKRFRDSAEATDWSDGDPVKIKVGLDANSFIEIAYYDVSESEWIMCARSSYPVVEGAEFKLGIKFPNSTVRLNTTPKVHLLDPVAPVMNFRYIESPDGYYTFPLFSTQEEADYYEEQVSGSDNGSSIVIFDDDPSYTQWYLPATSNQQNYGLTPVEDGVTTFQGNPIVWTEITSLTNADLAPPAYTDQTINVNELQSVNIQTQPQDTTYTTTFTGLPAGMIALGTGTITGTAPEVTGDKVANPNDDYSITVTRTNNYGSSTGTLTISVQNLTAPTVDTGNWTGADIVGGVLTADGTATLDITLSEGERLIIPKGWVDSHINPNGLILTGQTYLGVLASGADVTEVDQSDFDGLIKWFANSISNYHGAGLDDNLGGSTGDLTWTNSGATIYDFGIEYSDGQLHLIACNVNSINTEPSIGDGGSFTNVLTVGALTAPITVTLGTNEGATVDLTDADDLQKITIPAAPSNATSWTKALDFDGSAERTQQVDSSYYRVPMKMSGLNNQVSGGSKVITSSDADARPWATAIVFKSSTYNSNQHVWNVGEGTGDSDDNIYLRRDANRNLWFGMGRSGDLIECYIGSIANDIGGWHAVYIGHSGARFGSGNIASQLEDAFDFRYTSGSDSWAVGTNQSTQANWNSGTVGGRMNRSFDGDFTIGGRGANRSFRGKIASFVTTTLRRNVAMPTDAEIYEMITDPMDWLTNYKIGNPFRLPWQGGDAGFNFSLNDGSSSYATQVWLMGDGTNDSYSNMIRNQVFPNDQNYTKMNMISMVSNDIQNVTISGLS